MECVLKRFINSWIFSLFSTLSWLEIWFTWVCTKFSQQFFSSAHYFPYIHTLTLLLFFVSQGGSMPNTSSTSVPFLLSSSMQSIRSRRTSTVLSSGPLNSGSGLLSELRSGMVRMAFNPPVTSSSASPLHQHYNNGNKNFVRKCPSLNITFSN